MSTIIDLDALSPEAVTVKLGEEEIKINPPSLEDVLRLGGLSQKMAKFDTENLEDATTLIAELNAQLVKCAPGLKDKSLNTAQLLKLVTVITEMSVPPDVKELEKRGIKPEGPKVT